MLDYGQFCPVAKAAGVLGEKWTLLIVRELMLGSTRFKQIQRGLSRISPTVLAKRLKELDEAGILVRRRTPGGQGHEYFLTRAGRDLEPVIKSLGAWGYEWARGELSERELDGYQVMVAIQMCIDPNRLAGRETVFKFRFGDADGACEWWIVAKDDDVDICDEDPGREVDIYFDSDRRTMTEICMGDTSLAKARRDRKLRLTGPSALLRDLCSWFPAPPRWAGIAREPPRGLR